MRTAHPNGPITRVVGAESRRCRSLDAAVNVVALALLWVAYAAVRGVTGDTEGAARANASRLLAFEGALGVDIEAGVQRIVHWPIVHIASNSYYLLHFPLTFAVLCIAFCRARRSTFVLMRNAIVGCTGVALIVHLLVPMAPPRMLPGFVDSGLEFGPDPYALAGSESANQFAAMPSMHVAWAIVAGLAVWQLASTRALRVAAALHPIATTFVVVVTGHHLVTDAVIGAASAFGAIACALARTERPTTHAFHLSNVETANTGSTHTRGSNPMTHHHTHPLRSRPQGRKELSHV